MPKMELIDLIHQLIDDKFWGSVEIKFENGTPKICRKTESIKFE